MEELSVTLNVWIDCQKRVHAFETWWESQGLECSTPETTDAALPMFMSKLFFKGRMCTEGEKLMAAIMATRPEYGNMARNRLP